MKMWKVYDNNYHNDRTTDKFLSEKLTRAFGSGELKKILWYHYTPYKNNLALVYSYIYLLAERISENNSF